MRTELGSVDFVLGTPRRWWSWTVRAVYSRASGYHTLEATSSTFIGMTVAISGVLGLILGGAITQNTSWTWSVCLQGTGSRHALTLTIVGSFG